MIVPGLAPVPSPPPSRILQAHGFSSTIEERKIEEWHQPRFDFLRRIDMVERASTHKLPTDLGLAIAQSKLHDQELERAARLFARELDIPLGNFFPTIKVGERDVFVDPKTNLPISLRTARRVYRTYAADLFKTILDRIGIAHLNPLYVAAVFKTLGALRGEDLSLERALGATISIAQTVAPAYFPLFKHNLDVMRQDEDLSDEEKISLAHRATLAFMRLSDDPGDPMHPLNLFLADDPVAAQHWRDAVETAKLKLAALDEKPPEGEALTEALLSPGTPPLVPTTGTDRMVEVPTRESAQAIAEVDEELATGGLQEIPRGLTTTLPADVKLALDVLTGHGPQKSYKELADQIKADYAAQEEHYKNTWFGKTMHYAGAVLDKIGDVSNAAGYFLITNVLVVGDPGSADRYFDRLRASRDMLIGDLSLREQLIKEHNMSPGLAALLELGVQLVLDPLIIGGKIAHIRKLHTLIGYTKYGLGAEEWSNRVFELLGKRQLWLGGKYIDEFLYDGVIKHLDDPENFYDFVASRFRTATGVEGLAPETTDAIWSWANQARKLNLGAEETRQGIREILEYTLDVRFPGHTAPGVVERVLETLGVSKTYRSEEELRRANQMAFAQMKARGLRPGQIAAGLPYWQPWMAEAQSVAESETALHTMFDYWDTGRATMLALPKPVGPVKTAWYAVKKPFADTILAAGSRYRRSTLPTLMADIEKGFSGWLRQYLYRTKGLYSRREITELVQQAVEISAPFARSREGRWIKFLDDLVSDIVHRTAKRYGVPAEEAERLVTGLRSEVRKLNAHLFGIDDPSAFEESLEAATRHLERAPLQETQLPNQWMMPDPVRLKQILQDHISYRDRIAQAIRRVVGVELPEVKLHDFTAHMIANNQAIWLKDMFLRYWKAGVVATPRYVTRVVLTDEQMRFLADVGFLAWVRSRKMAARFAEALGVPHPETWLDYSSAEALETLRRAAAEAGFRNVQEVMDAIRMERAGFLPDDLAVRLSRVDIETRRVLDATLDFYTDLHKATPRANPLHKQYFGGRRSGQRALVESADGAIWVNEEKIASLVERGTPGTRFIRNIRLNYEPLTDMGPREAVVLREMGLQIWDQLPENVRRAFMRQLDAISKTPRAKWSQAYPRPRAYAREVFADSYTAWKYDPNGLVAPNAQRFFARYVSPIGQTEDRLNFTVRSVLSTLSPEDLKLRVVFPRPGELADEVAVYSGRAAEVFQSREQEMAGLLRRMAKKHEANARFWGEVKPTDPHYFTSLEDVLVNQFGRSGIGRKILRGLASNKRADEIIDDVVWWLTSDRRGRNVARRLGLWEADQVEERVEQLERMARVLTSGDPTIARLAYEHDKDLGTALRALPLEPESRPSVHGFVAAELTGRPNPAAVAWDYYSRAIFEWPTNKLSRHPHFTHWYEKTKRGLVENLKDLDVTPTPELLRRIDTEARLFAIERVRRVMFDFRAQSRWGEMLGFLVPFHQPWKEAFTVWGHLLRKNPAFAEQVRVIFKELSDSGFFRRDDVTGQLVAPLSNWLFVAPMLNMVYGKYKDFGWSLNAPLASFNFLFGSMFEIPTGRIAGNLPVPIPSLNPVVMHLIQKIADSDVIPDPLKYNVIDWAYQYGSLQGSKFVEGLLPTYVQHFMRGLGIGDRSLIASYAVDFLRMYEAQGLTAQRLYRDKEYARDAAGRTFGSVEEAQKFLAEKAEQQSRGLAYWRGFMSLFFPAAPSVQYPLAEREYEWRQTLDMFDGDYEKARDHFIDKHPENALITIASTFWSKPDVRIPIPANELADRFLSAPGIKEFGLKHPQWVFAFLPREVWSQNFDREVFFRQMDNGWRMTKGPLEFFQDADSVTGWDLWRTAHERWVIQQDWMDAKHLPEGGTVYLKYKQQYDDEVARIKELYPGFARDYETLGLYNLDPWVEYKVDQALSSELFRQTSVGRGLLEYRKLRKDIMRRMADLNIRSLKTATAEKEGLKEEYEKGVRRIIARYPDFERAYNIFFREDLQDVPTHADRLIDRLSPTEFQELKEWEIRWQRLRNDVEATSNPVDRVQGYVQLRDIANLTFERYGMRRTNPLLLWWETRPVYEQQQYRESILMRPYVFMSRFDRAVIMGEEVTDTTERMWLELGKIDVTIADVRANRPDIPLSNLYELRDRMANDFARRDKLFAKQLAHANTWAWTFQAQGFPERPGREGKAWASLIRTTHEAQRLVETYDLHGTADFDRAKRTLYAQIKHDLADHVDRLKEYSPRFKEEWERLEALNGGAELLDEFMPDLWFRLGKVDEG